MAEDIWSRLVTKMASGLPTIPVSASHNNGDWIDTDIYEGELYIDTDTGKVYTRIGASIVDTGSVGSVNIYNQDGALPAATDRNFNLSTNRLFIYNGKVFFGTDDPEWLSPGVEAPFELQVNGGVLTSDGGFNCVLPGSGDGFTMQSDGDGNAFTAIMDDANTFGLNLKASYNKLFDSDVTPDPSNENSSILTIWSTRKGSIPFPRMTDAEMTAIVSPAIGLMVYVTDATEGIYVNKSTGWTFVA